MDDLEGPGNRRRRVPDEIRGGDAQFPKSVVEVQGFSRHESVDTVMIYNDNRKRLGLRVQDSLALRVAGAAKEKP